MCKISAAKMFRRRKKDLKGERFMNGKALKDQSVKGE